MYSAKYRGMGRYCPSIEDKVVKFKKKGIPIKFLLSQGESKTTLYTQTEYPSSPPIETQAQICKDNYRPEEKGFSHLGMLGKYDFVDPKNPHQTLKSLKNFIKGAN
ncbi:MAG: hypothetical protein CM15mP12_4250 [Gammaproteobacteria bacterium]|nr:MAG: hypothetical protein CM15mP12_4250 [Gammaproteobacteria bacterium]